MKILLPVNEVPDGGLVTKRTGTKKYRVQKEFQIFAKPGREVMICGTSRFLVPVEDELIALSIVDGDLEVLWHATRAEVREYLDEESR